LEQKLGDVAESDWSVYQKLCKATKTKKPTAKPKVRQQNREKIAWGRILTSFQKGAKPKPSICF